MSEPEVTAAGGPIGIAGAGRIAQALGRLLRDRGEPVVAVASRELTHARAAASFIGGDIEAVSYAGLPRLATRVLIAVSDCALTPVAAVMAEAGMNRGAALHTCGAHGPEALAPLAVNGVSCGTLHPLQTVATPEHGLVALPGVSFAIDGDGAAVAWAEQVAALLEGQALRVPANHRAAYHAAAVVASNYVVGLLDAAAILMSSAGIDEDKALRALGPLVRTSTENALALGPSKALTGPVERGDSQTVSTHLKALAGAPESVRGLYRAAGLHVLELARRRGLPEARARELEKLLKEGERGNA